jgi:hypothetical protein
MSPASISAPLVGWKATGVDEPEHGLERIGGARALDRPDAQVAAGAAVGRRHQPAG